MSYHFSKTLDAGFDEAIEKVTAALKERGFGVLTTIDFKKAFKEKINEDFRPYTVLGACNPKFAFQALAREEKLGVMLPCNVLVQDKGDGKVEVSAVDPAASLGAIKNPELESIAGEVRSLIQGMVESL